MYNAEYFFVDNSLDRYPPSQRNKFDLNPDCSVDLLSPSTNARRENVESNWLPAPEGGFALILRCIGPKKQFLIGN